MQMFTLRCTKRRLTYVTLIVTFPQSCIATRIRTVLTRLQKYCLQLQTAASKDEAFNFAISAADNLMKALKLAPDANEKKDLRTQCGIIMDIADRIKKDSDWKLAVRPLGIEAETEQIDDRAAKDEHTTSSAPNLSDAASHSHSNLTQIDHISTTQLADGASAAKGRF